MFVIYYIERGSRIGVRFTAGPDPPWTFSAMEFWYAVTVTPIHPSEKISTTSVKNFGTSDGIPLLRSRATIEV